MRNINWIAGLTLGLGMAMTAAASDRDWDRRDLRHDYGQIERLRADVARDRARLDDDLRCGRRWAVDNDRRDLTRDQHALDIMLQRDAAYDRRDVRRDDSRNGSGSSYSNSFNRSR